MDKKKKQTNGILFFTSCLYRLPLATKNKKANSMIKFAPRQWLNKIGREKARIALPLNQYTCKIEEQENASLENK